MKRYLKFIIILIITCFGCNDSLVGRNRDTLSVGSIEFIKNENQWHNNVLFKTPVHGGAIFAEKDGLMFTLLNTKQLEEVYEIKRYPQKESKKFSGIIDGVAYKMKFLQCNPSVKILGENQKKYYHNYYIGNDPQQWATSVKVFGNIVYENLYDGIDLHLGESDGLFKYEFHLKAGVSADKIIIEYDGIKSLSLSHQNLIVTTTVGQITELKPFAYQVGAKGKFAEIMCKYKILKDNKVCFEIGNYDKSLPLVIDPSVIFSSYSGSTSDNWGYTATYDSEGNLYGGGVVFGNGYPITTGAYQVDYGGGICDIAISKFNATGNDLLYSTYLGGSGVEIPNSMVVNEYDELYLLGTTGSANFPVTIGAYSQTFRGGTPYLLTRMINFSKGSDMVVCKLGKEKGELLASTYLGGSQNDGLNSSSGLNHNYSDEVRGEINIDMKGNVCLVSSTFSSDFPVTNDAFQQIHGGGQDACIVKLNYDLSNIIWASFLGGKENDGGYSMSIASDNSIYVCGGTTSSDFPVAPNTVQPQYSGQSGSGVPDGFITHIHEFGNTILESTYWGTKEYDQTYLIKTNSLNYPYVFGQTSATGKAFIKNALWFKDGGGQFLTKLTPKLDNIVWSTAFGTGKGGPDISPTALLVDLCNSIYMSGWGSLQANKFGGTSGLPITSDAYQQTTDNDDFYFICINDDASALRYATFFGSPTNYEHVDGGTCRFDKKGKIYQAVCAGCGGKQDFPTTPGAWSEKNGSTNCNLGVIKMDFMLPVVVADFRVPNTICLPSKVTLENNSKTISSNHTFLWDFGDGTTSNEKNPTHEYLKSGIYSIKLVVTENGSCNFSDSIVKEIVVLSSNKDTLSTIAICDGEKIQIGVSPSPEVTYKWKPEKGLNNPNISNPVVSIQNTIVYTLLIKSEVCTDTLIQEIIVTGITVEMPNDTIICLGDSITITPVNHAHTSKTRYFWSDSPYFFPILNSDTLEISLTVAPTKTTRYYLKVITVDCEYIYKTNVLVSQILIEPISKLSSCFREPVEIKPNITCINCNKLYYLWSSDNPSSILTPVNQRNITVLPEQNSTYQIRVTNEYNCLSSDTITVLVQANTFENDFKAWANKYVMTEIIDTAMLYSTPYNPFTYQYQWSPEEGLSNPNAAITAASPSKTTIYTVVVTDSFGCTKSDMVKITVEPIICKEPLVFVPNAFTPNGDNLNDILYVRGEIIEKMLFRVYNRWGALVFESQDMLHGWDGTYKGKEAPAGVYDYYLEVTCLNKTYYFTKGNIQLLR